MGLMQALGLAEAADEGLIDLREAIAQHFQHNCYPPIPLVMLEPAVAAIEAAREEDYDRIVELPEDAEHRVYGRDVPARVVIDGLRIEAFAYYNAGE